MNDEITSLAYHYRTLGYAGVEWDTITWTAKSAGIIASDMRSITITHFPLLGGREGWEHGG